MKIVKIESKEDFLIENIVALAKEIYSEHYTTLLSKDFVDYWIKVYQSKEKIIHSIDEGEQYFLISEKSSTKDFAGYFSYVICEEKKEMFLSKFYLKKSCRGKKLGKQMFEEILEAAKTNEIKKIWLKTIRISPTVEIYKKLGFSIAFPIKTDIGENHILEDYVLSMQI